MAINCWEFWVQTTAPDLQLVDQHDVTQVNQRETGYRSAALLLG
jgi:hypothetical protein